MKKNGILKKLLYTGVCVSCVYPLVALSQNMTQIWPGATLNGTFGKNKNNLYMLNGEGRFAIPASEFRQLVLEGAYGYQATPKTSYWLGYSFTSTHGIDVGLDRKSRVWEQVLYNAMHTSHYSIVSRTRLEQGVSRGDSGVAVRLREKVDFKFPLPGNQKIIPEMFDEVFLYLTHPAWTNDNSLLDQNRVFLGVQVRLSSTLTCDIGYMNQYQITNTGNQNNKIAYLNFNFVA